MSVAVEKKTKEIPQTKSVKNFWTEDEVCNRELFAYEKGKEHIKKEQEKKYLQGLDIAKKIAEKILYTLIEKKISCKEIHLRQSNSLNFSAIFIISEKDFLSPNKYQIIYDTSNEIIQPVTKNGYNFECFFMPFSRHIDKTAILSDGFTWTFGEKTRNRIKNK